MSLLAKLGRALFGQRGDDDRTKRVLDKARARAEQDEKDQAKKSERRGPITRKFK